jgi:hypothetical protein
VARRIEVEIVGDSRSLERAFARSERSAKRFNGQMTALSRQGGAGGIGAMFGLGRATGPAAAGAVAFVGIKKAIDASREAEVVLGQTSIAVKDAGLSWELYAKDVDAAATRISRASAFDDEDVLRSFQVFVRGQKDVRKSLQLSELAADVARGRYTDLETATNLVNKAAMGNIGALRRAGIQIDKNATSAQALDALLRAYGGSAKKYADSAAGSSDKLQVAWENLAEQAGGPLSGALAEVADGLTKIVILGQAASKIKLPFSGTNVGGKGLLDLIGLGGIKGTSIMDLFGGGKGKPAASGGGAGFGSGLFDNILQAVAGATKAGKAAVAAVNKQQREADARQREAAARGVANRNTWFDQMIGRELVDVQDISTLKGQIARLKEISAQVTARIAVTKDITRKLTLEDQVKAIARDIRGKQGDIAAAVKARADDLAAAAKATKEKAKQAAADLAEASKAAKAAAAEAKRQATETQMGWLDFAVERAGATKTIKDDIKAQQDVIAFLQRRMQQEGHTLELVSEIWRRRQKIADLNKSKAGTDPLAGLMQVSSSKLTNILAAGTGLSGAGRRVLGANIAGAEIRPLHVHVNIDGREVGRAVTTQQARGANRTANQTSGRRG